VVGAVGKSDDAVRLIRQLKPQVALIDMAKEDGLDLVRVIARLSPEVKIVALSTPDDDKDVIAAAEASVSGDVTSDTSLDDLVTTLQRVADNTAD
jgi:DNA-binding NarL/FixJ family response regulator